MSKKILITGGAGYIGSQTNLQLLEAGYETVIFDNLSNGNLRVVPKETKFVEGDLLNKNDLQKVFRENKIDAVIHFAAFIEVGESVKNPQKYYKNNIVGTLNLLEAMKDFGIQNIVFSSTAAVYGLPETCPIEEGTLKNPINPYGWSKLMMEQIMDDYYEAYGIKSVRLRYFNACGADSKGRTGELHHPESHLIPLILQAALGKRDAIYVYGNDYETSDGTCVRDYIHTEDLADAHIKAVEKLLDGGLQKEAINLGCGEGYSVKEVIEKVKEITKMDFEVKQAGRRAGDPATLIASNRKAKELLGWEPKAGLEKIIKTAWDWHRKN